ncbi:MAG TPA: hypothetical protein VIR38_12175, partial [Thalassobaculum sp.]
MDKLVYNVNSINQHIEIMNISPEGNDPAAAGWRAMEAGGKEAGAMDAALIGARVSRVEDRRFLTGAGAFGDDLRRPGQAFAAVLRSPYPHARIGGIDAAAARAAAGALLVLT